MVLAGALRAVVLVGREQEVGRLLLRGRHYHTRTRRLLAGRLRVRWPESRAIGGAEEVPARTSARVLEAPLLRASILEPNLRVICEIDNFFRG